ncbi:MAG: purine-nucleoside phosphorylase [Clostridia bacterium]
MSYNAELIAKIIKEKINHDFDVALVLGSGLSGATPKMENTLTISYESLGMPSGALAGHNRCFQFGDYAGKHIVVASRIHYYEKGSIEEMRLPFEVLSALGVKTVVLTTAVGGVDPSFKSGDLMIVEDQINYSGVNPLIGIKNQWFVDMCNVYDKKLIGEVKKIAIEENFEIKSGVHMQLSGPTYETPAEVKMAEKLGASTVSMSTALDTIMCAHFKMKVLALASICNMAAGLSTEILTHEKVLEASAINQKKIGIILNKLIPKI